MTDSKQAYLDTALHFKIDPSEVTRDHLRAARKAGVHSIAEKAMGPLSVAKAAVLATVPKGHTVKGVSTLVGPDGVAKAQWVKTCRKAEAREELLVRLASELSTTVKPKEGFVPEPLAYGSEELLDVYPMGDPHLGMLAWAPETGKSFDLAKALTLAEDAIDHLTTSSVARHALIINLGDFFHADNMMSTTTAGTTVDTDSRLYKVLQAGRDLMVYTVEACLRVHDTVEVDNRNGNHDTVTSMFLGLMLDAYFRNDPRVKVNVSPSKFFYKKFGKCLIGATHGDTVKRNELQKIMSVDRREDWGETEHAYWYCGHVHHTSRIEDYGCTIETFRTLAPGDAWHHAKGYRSNRDMNRITLHKEDGEVSRALVKATALERRYKA